MEKGQAAPEYRGTRETPWEAGGTTREGNETEPETVCLQAVEDRLIIRSTACLLKNEPASYEVQQG